MGCSKLLDLALRGLFHPLTDLVDFAADHVVELAVVPDELDVVEDIFVGSVLAREQLLLASRKVHWVLHDLRVVKQSHLYSQKARV